MTATALSPREESNVVMPETPRWRLEAAWQILVEDLPSLSAARHPPRHRHSRPANAPPYPCVRPQVQICDTGEHVPLEISSL